MQVFINLILVSTTDPGIIPRNDQANIEDVGTSDGTRSKRVMINGVEMKLKYCRICKIFRPPRSCHCAVCDNCVEKFDHHCPWIGQCIALVRSHHKVMLLSDRLYIDKVSNCTTATTNSKLILIYVCAEKLSILLVICDLGFGFICLLICLLCLENPRKK